MIDIPLNKTLIPVKEEPKAGCKGRSLKRQYRLSDTLACSPGQRKDGKSIIFKLVDLPKEKK